ncbi:MAG TPA: DUF4124 domain-containing protein [Steroidobacteraceae bacterium]|nr:DUF4124 domain-containing protein [Steroidobacteraceae bacterium]
MRTALLLLLAFAAAGWSGTAASSTVYKWVDEKGVTHYSDRPVPGATRIEVSTGSASSHANAAPDAGTPSLPQSPAAPSESYRIFEIAQPQTDQVFINNGGTVEVQIRIDPPLQPGHSLNLYLDGRLIEAYTGSPSYTLQQVPRGTHGLVATINEENGTRVRETSPVTFTVRQESIANPPVGPGVRPQPTKPPRTGASNKLPTSQPSYAALNPTRPAIDPATNLPVVQKPKPKPKKP